MSAADNQLVRWETPVIPPTRTCTLKPGLGHLAQDLKVWHTILLRQQHLNDIITVYGESLTCSRYLTR